LSAVCQGASVRPTEGNSVEKTGARNVQDVPMKRRSAGLGIVEVLSPRVGKLLDWLRRGTAWWLAGRVARGGNPSQSLFVTAGDVPVEPSNLWVKRMSEVTRVLSAISQGDPRAAEQLLPLVYDELRRLAAAKLAHEQPGQTLEATALVHEAYLRLVGDQRFDSRHHFFAAAAQAMRRILIDSARRKQLAPRVDIEGMPLAARDDERLLEFHDALDRLAAEEPTAARVVEARVFAGLSVEEAAAALGLSRATAYREWAFARAWLAAALNGGPKKG
jgi:RNA polymerase sigma factor (TIGR02999 family)